MSGTADQHSEDLRAATLRERDQAGINAADYYYPPGWGEALDCVWAVGPFDCNTARNDADTALASAQTEFPNLSGHNDKADAYRHCYWNALMTLVVVVACKITRLFPSPDTCRDLTLCPDAACEPVPGQGRLGGHTALHRRARRGRRRQGRVSGRNRRVSRE